MKKFKKYIIAIITVLFIAGNLFIDFSLDINDSKLSELFNQTHAQTEDPTYPNGMDAYCQSGCIYYWSDDGMTIWYGIEIICASSAPGHHCTPFGGCTLGYC